ALQRLGDGDDLVGRHRDHLHHPAVVLIAHLFDGDLRPGLDVAPAREVDGGIVRGGRVVVNGVIVVITVTRIEGDGVLVVAIGSGGVGGQTIAAVFEGFEDQAQHFGPLRRARDVVGGIVVVYIIEAGLHRLVVAGRGDGPI